MEPRNTPVTRVNQFKLSPEPCADGPFKGYEKLHWINSAASRSSPEKFMNLMHVFNDNNLKQAFRQLDGNKAVGIDGVSKKEYQRELQSNLVKLQDEIYRGGWRPKPSREVLIPKPQGGTRPLAIGCLEDKIVQLLASKVLEAIYEPIFHRHSFGFRPGRNTHQALSRLYKVVSEREESCTIVEMDIEKFFNSMDHELLIQFIERKIGDQSFLRLIRRMLRNSILSEEGEIKQSERGSPQGAPVSPILANIYLHYVLDEWFDEKWSTYGQMIRYCDDAVFVFSSADRATEFMSALKERMQTLGKLNLNADKSGLLPFSSSNPKGQLPFVGFCLYWGQSTKNKKKKLLKVKTAPKKLGKSIEAFADWIKSVRYKYRLDAIWDMAAAKLRGHYQYYGVSYNRAKLSHYYFTAIKSLFKWLNRRSQKKSFTWERFQRRLMFKPLPRPTESAALLDITMGLIPKLKRKPRSRMPKSGTYGSNRSANRQRFAFT
jgi:group II intron reverse transcriptase/maturase